MKNKLKMIFAANSRLRVVTYSVECVKKVKHVRLSYTLYRAH